MVGHNNVIIDLVHLAVGVVLKTRPNQTHHGLLSAMIMYVLLKAIAALIGLGWLARLLWKLVG